MRNDGSWAARVIGALGTVERDDRINVKSAGIPLSGNSTPGRAWKYDIVTDQIIFKYNAMSRDGVTTYDQF